MTETVTFERQRGVFDTIRFGKRVVDVIGGGGVGAFVAADLADEGVSRIRLFDGKRVAPHNPPNQLHARQHIGMNKAHSVNEMVEFMASRSIDVHARNAGPAYVHGDVVISCVDSMRVRKRLMRQLFASKRPPSLVIETRIDTNYIVLHTLIPSNRKHQKQYWHYWFPDREGVNDGGCSDKRALRCAASLAASVAVSQLVQWFGNGERDLSTAPDNQIRITMRPWSSEAHQW